MFIDTAILVEPRLHISLEAVINNAIDNLDNMTKIHIFHGKLNKQFLETTFNTHIQNGKIILTNMNILNFTRVDYSNMLVTLDFWNKISGENLLIFQTDSCICCHVNNFNLSAYNDFGYVGAPSKKTYPIPWQNGGFSLRKKSLMIQAVKDRKLYDDIWPEDRYFSIIKQSITKPATYELANKFSVEQFYYSHPFGIHKAWKYLSPVYWKELKKNRPIINNVFSN